MTPYYRNTVRALDKNADLNTESAKAAALMLAALKHGCRQVRELARVTGVDTKAAFAIARRLRSNGVWRSDGKTHAEWAGDGGGVAFWMDVCVAVGWMNKTRSGPNGTGNANG